LLTAQLQQQDPTQPMDNTAFVAQLAQFSSLEQMSNANDTLTKMLTAQSTALQTTAASMVGKTAAYSSNEVTLTKGQPVPITANLAEAAADVNMTIHDSDGNTVRTVDLGPCLAGPNNFQWDGLDDNQSKLPSGSYTTQITAKDLGGNSVSVNQTGHAPITGVKFDNGVPSFIAGGASLQLSDISELDQ
jgi:flagellar basal-body rod modification protein FlgD